MSNPEGLYSDGTKLILADYADSRVLVWDSLPSTTGKLPDAVLGEVNMTANFFEPVLKAFTSPPQCIMMAPKCLFLTPPTIVSW